MALGKRLDNRQQELFIATAELARAPGHAFNDRGVLLRLLGLSNARTRILRSKRESYDV